MIENICAEQGKPIISFTDDAIKELQKISWTGNIRELRNVIERLAILCENEISGDDVKKYAQPLSN